MSLNVSTEFHPPVAADWRVLTVKVKMPDGRRLEPAVRSGRTLAEALRAFGIPMLGACDGHGACAACRVRVAAAWRRHLPEPTELERAGLGTGLGFDESVRLACRIVMAPALDGLELELHPDSLTAQTYWVAG